MKFLLSCGCLMMLCLTGLAQEFPHLVFQRFYDNLGDDIPRKIVKSVDGNLMVGGNTLLTDPVDGACANIWIIKIDTLGELIWEKEVAISGCEELRDMVATQDGGALFTGVSSSLISHEEKGDEPYWGDFLIGKVDQHGTMEWLESYGGSNLDQAHSLAEGIYREFMVVGSSHSRDGDVGENYGRSDLWALKVDSNGKLRLNTVFGGKKNEWGNAVSLCQNGDYLIAGFGNSPLYRQARPGKYGNGLLVRIAQSGEIVWERSFSCPFGGYFTSVTETPIGEILVAGNYHDGEIGYDAWWLRLSGEGQIINENRLPEPNDEYLSGMDLCEDGGRIMIGYSIPKVGGSPYDKGGEDFWLIRTDERGQILWRQTYGGPEDERGASVLMYRPGVFYAIGAKINRFTRGGSKADQDFWLLRMEEYPEDSLQADIFVRAKDFRIERATPTRFRAKHKYGERFLWDFGDGTHSEEEQPLKSYSLSGTYEVSLTIFTNENCRKTVQLSQPLEVW